MKLHSASDFLSAFELVPFFYVNILLAKSREREMRISITEMRCSKFVSNALSRSVQGLEMILLLLLCRKVFTFGNAVNELLQLHSFVLNGKYI